MLLICRSFSTEASNISRVLRRGRSAHPPMRRDDRTAARLRSGASLPAQVIGATPEHLTAEDIPVIDLSLERLPDTRTHRQSALRRNVPLEGETNRLELCETVGGGHWR